MFRKIATTGLAVLAILIAVQEAHSREAFLTYSQTENFQQNSLEYFTISEIPTPTKATSSNFENPLVTFGKMIEDSVDQKKATQYSLLNFIRHRSNPSSPREKYARLKHFGSWRNDPMDGLCYNTRAKILIRDSKTPVQFRDNNPCSVATGEWKDPYTGETLYTSQEIQIDHFVPLKHAYISGAHKWSPQRRCHYANFMANRYHLISVEASENMKKSDGAPDEYVPPNQKYVCKYIENWLKIKLTWNLVLFTEEVEAIENAIHEHQCDESQFNMAGWDLSRNRSASDNVQDSCESFGTRPRPANPEHDAGITGPVKN
ncbi:MAG: HNH endonuclease family protein [Proteobacteria bacterium]|nr:HNH endonuclease family protein [Pseudomonadota bacterium]